jgi:hypothetical protein
MNYLDRFFSVSDIILDKSKKPFYYFMSFIFWTSNILLFLGIYYVNPVYMETTKKYMEIFICIFLIIRFNPLRKAILHEFDQYLIFISGIIILTNIGILEYINAFIKKDFSNIIDKMYHPVFHVNKSENSLATTFVPTSSL